MKADIFIPTSNRVKALSSCLESLLLQTRKDFKIYLVGIEKSVEVGLLVEKYKELPIEYFIQRKAGIIGAGNEALERAQNEIFVRIDDDVVLNEAWYEKLMETFEGVDDIGGVTGPTIMSKEGIMARDLTAFLNRFQRSNNPVLKLLGYLYGEYLYENRMFEVSQFLKSGAFTLGSNYPDCLNIKNCLEVGNLEACNWSVRTTILKKNGGFDEIYCKGIGDYHEADAALRIKKLGYKLIFNPKVKLKHNVEISVVGKARPAPFYRIQNFFIFYSRHMGFKSASHFLKFSVNVMLQNGYYIYRFATTGKVNQLGAIPGTLIGIIRYFSSKL